MIVFGAIVPHSPLLIPSIGKDHREKLEATLKACKEIEEALYLTKPDTICMIAPHGARYPDAFSINLAAKYTASLKSFGDHSTVVNAKSDYLLIDHIQRKLRSERVPFTLTSTEELEYGYTVPLLLLTSNLENWKLIPVSPSDHDALAHFEFGRHLKRVLHSDIRRVAIIASADLSHALSKDAPGGDTHEGSAFDEAIRTGLSEGNAELIMKIAPEIIGSSSQCGYRPIVTLLGAIDGMNMKPRVLSYEAPFGVGYLTARFDLG
ncbi:MAG: AmmeMemoRadiSam system protein B [bacterium]|nr:AmmeMemoRadiSam system protein B [bacterium]